MKNNLELHSCVLGPVMTNCYLLLNKNSKEVIIVDPADSAAEISKNLEKLGAQPVAVLLTHGHFDHILAANILKEQYQIPIYAGKEEENLLKDPNLSLTRVTSEKTIINPDQLVEHLEVMNLAGFQIQAIHTPGHTEGSYCYYFMDENVLISGDTLFCGSVGRTDLPTGNGRAIIDSLNMLLNSLPDETEVYPGHDRSTNIGYEKRYNPFVR